MASNEPSTKNLAELYELAPLAWEDVRGRLASNLTQTHQFDSTAGVFKELTAI